MSTLGNINSCLNPKLIYNKYTDTKMYVPCRKCFRCRDTYGSEWSRRCENECKQHRYSLFVTLTYDNDHIPLFEPMIDDNGNLMSAWCSNRGFENGKFISSDIARSCPPVGMEDTTCFAYPCKKDIQDFMKRLRSCIDYNLNRPKIQLLTDKSKFINENRLRYFICSEYGPRTFRPHYHAIFWYASEALSDILLGLYVKLGRTAIRSSNLSTTPQVGMLRNMLTAILVYHRFFELNIPVRSIWQVNILISGIVKMRNRRCTTMSLMELMDKIESTKILARLNLYQLPVLLKIGSCQSVKDTAQYLILKEYEYIRLRMIISNKA